MSLVGYLPRLSRPPSLHLVTGSSATVARHQNSIRQLAAGDAIRFIDAQI